MRQVLDSWAAVKGIDKADVIFRVEPGQGNMVELVATFTVAKSVHIIVNETRLGALGNPYACFETGFETGQDFVILAEDDSIVAPDILDYFSWASEVYSYDRSVLAVCTFCGDGPCDDIHRVIRRPNMSPTIWGTWFDRWAELRQSWDFDYSSGTPEQPESGWDWNINLRVAKGRQFIYPRVSRSQHIGKENGTHMLPEDFEAHQSPCFRPDLPISDHFQEY